MIWIGDDVGTQNAMLMSPDTWRRFLKPRMARFISTLKAINPAPQGGLPFGRMHLPHHPRAHREWASTSSIRSSRRAWSLQPSRGSTGRSCASGDRSTSSRPSRSAVPRTCAGRWWTGSPPSARGRPHHRADASRAAGHARGERHGPGEHGAGHPVRVPGPLRTAVEDGKLSYHPLYLQVKDVLMKRIVDGVHTPGGADPQRIPACRGVSGRASPPSARPFRSWWRRTSWSRSRGRERSSPSER